MGRRFAGPFTERDEFPIPADKKLDARWVRSLRERGVSERVTGDALASIGMPIGGLFAGTVYLGGDGRLWNWDVFNEHHEGCVPRESVTYRGSALRERDGANYVDSPAARSPFEFSVALHVDGVTRSMDRRGFGDVTFRGEYPVGMVSYADPSTDLTVQLEAFSPFVPLDVERSSHPATVLRYTIANTGERRVEARLVATFENPVLLQSRARLTDVRWTCEARVEDSFHSLTCSATRERSDALSTREDLVFEDWEHGTYEGWEAAGTAFGETPRHVRDIAGYQGNLNAQGDRLVNSHETRHGEDVRAGDQHQGTLTSRPFHIERRYVNFRIGGGAHEGRTCINLLVDGKVARSATGRNANRMHRASFDVRAFEGREARLQIVDLESGGWGNIGVDEIVFADRPVEETPLEELPDHGTYCIALLGGADVLEPSTTSNDRAHVGRSFALDAGEETVITFVVAWYFPNLRIPGLPGVRRWYASRWPDALAVARSIATSFDELRALTLRWRDTFYDSTLPHWLLDRTFLTTSTLATNTCHRFHDGRYWFWEGIGCCAGSCTHVWSYAQGIARIFPEIERTLREQIDFGRAFHEETGAIDYRAEFGTHVAHDGQCGCILRAYREHRMSPDGAFLARIWPRVQRALEYMIREDGDEDGLLTGAQYNTLDAAWYGPMGWLSSLYLAAVAAGAAMARERSDEAFARRCDAILERGSRNAVAQLWNGEYFVHRRDPDHPEANGTGDGCHIDQVYGQAWAHQVGLGRVLPAAETVSALQSLWKYNFAPDVGVYRDWMKVIRGGRWYAVHGEAGTIMCTFPKGGADQATGKGNSAWAAMYLNECMTGFEYQVAAHMLWEGLVTEGLAMTRAIHDRYHPTRRNPYNEIECSDHYGRALASYGVYLAACGFELDGPRGYLAFSPRIAPEAFQAAWTGPEGFGTFGQERTPIGQRNWITVRAGTLRLREVAVDLETDRPPATVVLRSGDEEPGITHGMNGRRIHVVLAKDATFRAGETVTLRIH